MHKLFLIIIVLSTIIYGEEISNKLDNRFATKINLSNIEDINFHQANDSKQFKSPAIPAIASLAIPGLGQYLNHSPWWKTALFAGVEVAGIAGYIAWNNKGDDKRDEFENWADAHWEMGRWVSDSSILLSTLQSEVDTGITDVRIDGSHHITIIVNGKYESSHILVETPNIEYIEIRDWDFYEGIGKYDQFVAGWDDAKTDWEIVEKSSGELIVLTPNKRNHINLRNDSNVLYNRAKFAATVLLFNHLLSALDALWFANKNIELSYNIDVSQTLKSNFVLKGISVQWSL